VKRAQSSIEKNAEEDFALVLKRADTFIDSKPTGANFQPGGEDRRDIMTY
jgi:hypothetical protein